MIIKVLKNRLKLIKSFEHYYKDVQVYENDSKVSKVDIKLSGKIHKGRFIWRRLKFSEELQGNITIGGKTYSLSPVDLYEFIDEDYQKVKDIMYQ